MAANPQSSFAIVSQEFMTAVVKAEKAAKRSHWIEGFNQVSIAMRAQAAIIGVFAQTLDLTMKELRGQGEVIEEMKGRIEDLEGQLGNVARGLESLESPHELGDSFPGLADRHLNTKERES